MSNLEADGNLEKRIHQIRKILQETVDNLQILRNISLLTRSNGKVLYRYLPKTDAEFVLEILMNFTKTKRLKIEHDIAENTTGNRPVISRLCNDMEFAKIVDLILNSKCIRKYLKTVGKSTQSTVEKFISYIDKLGKIIEMKLKFTVMDETKMEEELKEAFVENEFLKNRIKELETILAKQQAEFDKEHEQYEKSYRELTETLENLQEKYNFDLQQLTYESVNSMMKLSLDTEPIHAQLKEDLENFRKKYEEIVETHQKEEKQLRIALSKIETQLKNWVEKYDKDMMEKLAEYEGLETEYNAEMEQVHQLEDKLALQFNLYTTLMKEKHDEEERIFMEAFTNFVENRAAKIIQRAWREYRRRKKAKKKKKGKKGQKRKEEKVNFLEKQKPNLNL